MENLGLDIDFTHSPFTVVSLSGDLDVYSGPRFRNRTLDVLNQGNSRLVIDLTSLEFIDSCGLGLLIAILKRLMAKEGDLSLVCRKARSGRYSTSPV